MPLPFNRLYGMSMTGGRVMRVGRDPDPRLCSEGEGQFSWNINDMRVATSWGFRGIFL
mgnify:CR=1 FL=1|jgi:hypothetical protein